MGADKELRVYMADSVLLHPDEWTRSSISIIATYTPMPVPTAHIACGLYPA